MIPKPLSNSTNILLSFCLFLIVSCSAEDNSPKNVSWDVSEGFIFPEGGKLSRAEDGVMLPDGTLVVADGTKLPIKDMAWLKLICLETSLLLEILKL